ncbi:MAG: efflux RND transporter permease subunit [Planctomycetota bacterium]
MRSVIQWAIKNSPAMNTFLIASMLVGVVSMVIMRREVFPNFALEILLVTVPLPGATPEEVEDNICKKVESEISNIDGIKQMTSVANEGFGYVILELKNGVDVQKVLREVEAGIKQVRLPEEAERSDVKQIIFRAPAISVGVLAPNRARPPTLAEERELRSLAEEIRAELLELRAVSPEDPVERFLGRHALAMLYQPKGPCISSAEITAARPYEISVELSEDTLRKYGLTLQAVASEIRNQTADQPGGTIKTESQEMILRANNKVETGEDIAVLPLITTDGNGDPVAVGDIATVIDGFAETTRSNLVNGREGLVVRVSKTSEEDLFTIVESVKDYVSKKQLPPGYTIDTWGDVSVDVRDRIELLSRNGMQGLILVFIVLAIFLELRLAFWVAMGIPISILGAGFILLITGQTLNMLTMFAFLMALGIVVDDAIVIGENIYAKREQGLSVVAASIQGTYEVLPAVCASVTTTIIAFMPLMYVTGVMGKFISIMPVVVIAMLAISLFESTFILPAHLAHDNNLFMRLIAGVLYIFKPIIGIFTWVNKIAAAWMEWMVESFYQPLLYFSLRNKRIVLSVVTAGFLFAGGLVYAGFAELAFFPNLDGREISATVAFPNGSPESFTQEAVDELELAFRRIDDRVKKETGKSVIKNLYRRIGEVGDSNMGPTGITEGSHVGTVEVQLTQPSDREITTKQLKDLWRDEIPKIAGTEALKFGSRSMGPGGGGIEFKLLADEKSVSYLDEATEECKEYLAGKLGVSDIEDDDRAGKKENLVKLNDLGRSLGLDEATLARSLRGGYFGEEVRRLPIGRHEVKLMVRYPEESRRSMEDFEQIRIRDNDGIERPLLDVATLEVTNAASKINRLNQRRSITVSASVDSDKANAREIIAEMKAKFVPELTQRFRTKYGANISVNWEGEQAQNEESVMSMFTGFAIALACMYVLLTLQFRSYIQPLIILLIIPFGWLGAIIGHAIMGLDITLFSFFGLIALTGVVVNDSIVLVDFINRRISEGLPLFDALMSAGKRRFRPIMLTSFTTVAGLFPILMETSLQAQVLIPMAASLIFGLITGTLLILILVPIFYDLYGKFMLGLNIPLGHDDEELENAMEESEAHVDEESLETRELVNA